MDNNTYFELSAETVTEYRKRLGELEESEGPYEQLGILGRIFESFENSHYPQGRGPEWATELISVYRHLGGILTDIAKDLSEEERQKKKIQDLEREVREYEESLGSLETL